MPRTSKIWDYFTVSDEDNTRAKCNVCSALISRGGKTASNCNTSNLKSHLKSFHRVVYIQYEELRKRSLLKSEKLPRNDIKLVSQHHKMRKEYAKRVCEEYIFYNYGRKNDEVAAK